MSDFPYRPISMDIALVSHRKTKQYGIEFRFPVECGFVVMSRDEALRAAAHMLDLVAAGDAHRVAWAPEPDRGKAGHEAAG